MRKFFKSFCGVLIFLSIVAVSISCFKGLDNSTSTSIENVVNKDSNSAPHVIDFSEKTYVAFGDSITAERNGVTYAQFVREELNLKEYLVCGYSGYTLGYHPLCPAPLSDKIVEFDNSYDIISLMGGVNDWAASTPLGVIDDTTNATVYGALNIIASSLKTRYPNSFIFFMTPYKHIGWDGLNGCGYNLSAVATAVKDVATKYDIPVLDMFNLGQFEIEMNTPESDGCHPSKDFIQNYTAPQIAQFIKDNYNK